jgi:uncharacterized protein (TIGR02453 family)
MPQPSPFTPELFAFFRDLRKHNDKSWFEANRARYEAHVLEPSKTFVLAFRPRLREISSRFQAEPRVQDGSLFRIHANLRFSPNAPPYKEHAGIQFRHARRADVHAPGFYLHLEPEGPGDSGGNRGGCFVGLGIWHPERNALAAIRERIVDDPDGWNDVTRTQAFTSNFRLSGDSLKRGPAGFDRDHPLIEDIKRKDFIAVAELAEDDVTSDGFVERFAARCRAGAPFVAWLCDAVGVEF